MDYDRVSEMIAGSFVCCSMRITVPRGTHKITFFHLKEIISHVQTIMIININITAVNSEQNQSTK